MADWHLRTQWPALVILALVVMISSGCGGSADKDRDDFLIRVDGQEVSEQAFYDALEIAKTAYPYDVLRDETTLKTVKTRLLKQLTEELILTRRAEELGITVTDEELEEAVSAVKNDYPEDAFEEALLENAISLPVWKKRLRIRLLMEKLIEKELVEKVILTPDEIMEYYEKRYPDPKVRQRRLEAADPAVVKHLRREEAQKKYPEWINGIQEQYRVELNSEKWEEILS
ncbi:MAG: SurA N-terminal domain-containing protein [Desulfosudaceae bacterium]